MNFLECVAISLDERAECRKAGDYKKADEIRRWLNSFLWTVSDQSGGGFVAYGPTRPVPVFFLDSDWTIVRDIEHG